MALKKSTVKKTKGKLSRATIGAPADPPPGGNGGGGGNTDTPPPNTNRNSSGDGKNWVLPKSYDQEFTPVGIPDDDQWHLDYPVAQIQMNTNVKHPIDVVRFWMQNDGARLKNAQPFDPQHGDYSGFGGTNTLLDSKRYKDAVNSGPSYIEPNSSSTGSYSAETIRYSPGSFSTGVTNGMTNRDKYKGY